MKTDMYIASLIQYSLDCGLIEPCDCTYMTNQLLQVLGMDSYTPTEPVAMSLDKILKGLLDDAVERGVCGGEITSRDLLDTKLMGILTPPPQRGAEEIHGSLSGISRDSDGLVLPLLPGYGLHPPLPHPKGYALENKHRVWRPGHHHQPEQAGKGSQGHRRGEKRTPVRLSQVPALPGK